MEKHILVIDDDVDIVELLKLSLEVKGYRVATASSAREAQKQLELQPADLIITDIFMDDGDGYEVIFKWRRQGKICKLIAISGGGASNGPETFLETARLAGAHRTFIKPFDRNELLRAVDDLLGVPHLRRAISSRRLPVVSNNSNSEIHNAT